MVTRRQRHNRASEWCAFERGECLADIAQPPLDVAIQTPLQQLPDRRGVDDGSLPESISAPVADESLLRSASRSRSPRHELLTASRRQPPLDRVRLRSRKVLEQARPQVPHCAHGPALRVTVDGQQEMAQFMGDDLTEDPAD